MVMPSWLWFAILSGVFYTGSNLLTRSVLRDQHDSWAFSFYFSLIGLLVTMPFVMVNPSFPKSWQVWLLMLIVGFLVVTHNWLNFRSANFIEASIGGSISKFRLVWVFLMSLSFLREVFSWQKLLGTVATLSAGWVLINAFQKKPNSLKGVIYAFLATMVYAIATIISKYSLVEINAVTLTFFIFGGPTILNLLIMPQAISRVTKLIKTATWGTITACALGGLANLTMFKALSLGEASQVIVMIESAVVTTLVGEHIFLKETKNLMTKVIAVVLALAGALLIQLK